ncbi:MAG: hypothetical protein KAU14_02700, partial [Thermoplasmata archaeon]|nr:hypothetical protein [Thermoplasmata archaeon]
MEYKNKPHRLISLGIFLVTAVLLLSVIPFTGNADESHPFYGWVYDQDSRRPIENVKVTLFDPDFEEEIINDMTDINGEFTLDAEPGHYIVHYSHSRYLSTASFEMMNDEDENLGDVFLTKITRVE